MKVKRFIITLFIFSMLISCNRESKQSEYTITDLKDDVAEKPPLQQNGSNEKQKIPVGNFPLTSTDSGIIPIPVKDAANPDWDKKIIRTATLRLEVKDFKKYNDNVHKTVKQFGGYIAQEEQNLSEEKTETDISIKVPVAQFETMMNQLPGDDAKVLERKVSTEDVTGEVVDTKSRLEAKKQMRIKYLEFLKQSKNMEEVLQVQNEINSIQEEIESAAGRVEYLSRQSAYSTINLTFYQPINGYRPFDGAPSFYTRLTGAFKTGGGLIADLFVGLVSVWPLLLMVFAIYLGLKKWRPAKAIAQKS